MTISRPGQLKLSFPNRRFMRSHGKRWETGSTNKDRNTGGQVLSPGQYEFGVSPNSAIRWTIKIE
jgi:hypothetical protein